MKSVLSLLSSYPPWVPGSLGRMRQVLSCIRAQLPIPQWLVPLELVKRFLARGPNKNHDFQGGFIGKNDGFNGKNMEKMMFNDVKLFLGPI